MGFNADAWTNSGRDGCSLRSKICWDVGVDVGVGHVEAGKNGGKSGCGQLREVETGPRDKKNGHLKEVVN